MIFQLTIDKIYEILNSGKRKVEIEISSIDYNRISLQKEKSLKEKHEVYTIPIKIKDGKLKKLAILIDKNIQGEYRDTLIDALKKIKEQRPNTLKHKGELPDVKYFIQRRKHEEKYEYAIKIKVIKLKQGDPTKIWFFGDFCKEKGCFIFNHFDENEKNDNSYDNKEHNLNLIEDLFLFDNSTSSLSKYINVYKSEFNFKRILQMSELHIKSQKSNKTEINKVKYSSIVKKELFNRLPIFLREDDEVITNYIEYVNNKRETSINRENEKEESKETSKKDSHFKNK